MLSMAMVMVIACAHPSTGIGERYAAPIDPACITEVPGYGLYDYRACTISELGPNWVKEKRLREKYEKQVDIINKK